jgi:hypothetical protein
MSPKMKSRPLTISHSVGSDPSLMPKGLPFEQKPPYCS